MDEIKSLLSGVLDMSDFLEKLRHDGRLQEEIKALFPREAIGDPDHPFYYKWSYERAKKYHFDFYALLSHEYRSDGSIGDNYNIFSEINRAYKLRHPEFISTTKYSDALDIYLEVIHDCFDGPEVETLVQKTIYEAIEEKSKAARKRFAKTALRELFHIDGRNYPYWIQGPEWPMGSLSPMRYVGRTRKKESIEYLFEDVDTGTRRTVTQFY